MSQAIQEAAAQGGSLANLCGMAGISRACYYKNIARGLCAPEPASTDGALREQVQQIALDCSCYGYRRVMATAASPKSCIGRAFRRTTSASCA